MAEANIPISHNDFQRISDKVILFGDNSTGKSFCIATLLKDCPEDRRIIYLMTERNAVSGLQRGLEHYNVTVEPGQLIYAFPKRKDKAFVNLQRATKAFQKETKVSGLKGKPDTTQGKEHYSYFSAIFDKLEAFTGIDYVTGETVNVGNVGDLDLSDILITDGLSPIFTEVWKLTQGDKIAISQTDYMPAQLVMNDIFQNLGSIECPVILMAHEKQIHDEKGNVINTIVNTGTGVAMYSTYMGCFTEIIHCYRFGTKYLWECERDKVACNSRSMPKETNLIPDFRLYNLFGNRGTYVEKKDKLKV